VNYYVGLGLGLKALALNTFENITSKIKAKRNIFTIELFSSVRFLFFFAAGE